MRSITKSECISEEQSNNERRIEMAVLDEPDCRIVADIRGAGGDENHSTNKQHKDG